MNGTSFNSLYWFFFSPQKLNEFCLSHSALCFVFSSFGGRNKIAELDHVFFIVSSVL